MQSRIATGAINKLSGEPWPNARVHFDLINSVLESCDFAPPQCLTLKTNSQGLLEVPLLVGGTYKMTLADGQTHEFTVAAGTGSFCLWDAVVIPPTEDYPWFVRVDGDTIEGDLDFNGNAIANASIDSSNTIQFLTLAQGVRPSGLEPGQTAYGPADGLLWVGTGLDESFAADGSQVIPSPSQGKGWREFSLVDSGGGGGGGVNKSVSFVVSDSDLIGNSLVVTHGLNSEVVDVSVRDWNGNALFVQNFVLSNNSISISFEGLRPLANPYRILVES